MQIYIPTRGRSGNQVTLEHLPKSLYKYVTFVVDSSENFVHKQYLNRVKVLTCPSTVDTIGKVRQYICDQHNIGRYGPKLLMLDDDLRFAARRTDQQDKFRDVIAGEIETLIQTIDYVLDKHAHCGVLAREGGNRVTEQYKSNTRLLRALGYRVDVMREHSVRFDRLIVMEDFDVALQLMELGYDNVAICDFVQDQGKSNAPGGCSAYRTLERQAEGARGLKELHPAVVQTVIKTTKTAWNGATRTDVIVGWKKARASYKGEPRVL